MKPTYKCINGHTFERPLIGDRLDNFVSSQVYACPECYTRCFEEIPTTPEMEDEDDGTKTCVTKVGKKIRGFTMIPFKCPLCSCEFESPISECSMFIVERIDIDGIPAARHKCPNELCGVECEIILDKDSIFCE